MKKYDIKTANLEFKNLLSGPAPVGRILNYIYLVGTIGLKHKNGNRTTNLQNGVGYAWTTEFMIGLGLVSLGSPVGNAFKLELTDVGTELFALMEKNYKSFDEGSTNASIDRVRKQIQSCNPRLFDSFKNAFINSYPFKILREFLLENGFYYKNSREFINNLFEIVKNQYDSDTKPYIQESRTTTGENRVPSLLQLCKVFNLLTENGYLQFDEFEIVKIDFQEIDREYNEKELIAAEAEERALIINSTKDLISMYGEDGNVIVSAIVRNSSLQTKFKHNLTIQQKGKCVVCGMEHKELLIGSHIKSSATSDVVEKIDHNNGLLLCCNHDKLFDRYLITFDADTGRIKISKDLTVADIKRLSLSENFSLSEELLTKERQDYLRLHNTKYEELEKSRKHK